MEEFRRFPLHQGALDSLCVVYAAINLLHIHGRIAEPSDATALFNVLIPELRKSGWNSEQLLLKGMEPGEDVLDLLWQVGFDKARAIPPTWEEIVASSSKTPGTFLCFEASQPLSKSAKLTHYTVVVRDWRPGRLKLFDSLGFETIVFNEHGVFCDGIPIHLLAAWEVAK